MKTVEIRYEELFCILRSARKQIKDWSVMHQSENDRKVLQKIEELQKAINEDGTMDFIITERPF